MYLLTLLQENNETKVGLFDSLEDGRDFVQKIPGYRFQEEQSDEFLYTEEFFEPSGLPDYMELEHRGTRVPLTRWMFPEDMPVEIIWHEPSNLSIADQGLVDGQTRVDAYMVENPEVSGYIMRREEKYQAVKAFLEANGYEVQRNFFGSEDGEAIVYTEQGKDDWHFLLHLDANFIEETPIDEETLKSWLLILKSGNR